MAITQGITSRSFGRNPHDDSGKYALPAEIEHVEVGREVVWQQPDPGPQSSLAKPVRSRPAPLVKPSKSK